jgi:hypothetical protein
MTFNQFQRVLDTLGVIYQETKVHLMLGDNVTIVGEIDGTTWEDLAIVYMTTHNSVSAVDVRAIKAVQVCRQP